jgi:hypothetical protein
VLAAVVSAQSGLLKKKIISHSNREALCYLKLAAKLAAVKEF